MSSGDWLELERSWYDTSVVYCRVCGRLIPRRAWVFDGGEGPVSSCSPECETLYLSYLRPKYGALEPDDQR